VDRVLVVDCSETVQKARLMVRDGETVTGVERLLAAQLDRATRLDAADDVLDNNGTRDELRERVRALHNSYLQFAADSQRGGVKGLG
jgi:dephospho-CoA kinase